LLSVALTSFFGEHFKLFSRQWRQYFLFFFLVGSSHGILDAMTDGGLGIALLSPFDNHRYFYPWTPIVVFPIGLRGFFSHWGLMVMISEITYVWTPLLICLFACRVIIRKFYRQALITSVPDN
jgi:inner membrane protein